jgi:H+/Cl- antiporter ClcA
MLCLQAGTITAPKFTGLWKRVPNRSWHIIVVAVACAVAAYAVYFAIRYSLFDKAEIWQLGLLLLVGACLALVGIVYITADFRGWSDRKTSRIAVSVAAWTLIGIPLMGGGAYALNAGSTELAVLSFAGVFMLGLLTSFWNVGIN